TRNGYALDTFLISDPVFAASYRDLISLIEYELSEALRTQSELPPPSQGRLSRLSRSFPATPTVDLRPDERGRQYLLTLTGNDRNGLLYAIAGVLARHKVNLHTAKIMTLGERIEDIFLIDGAVLDHPRSQLQLESDLLDVLRI